MTGQFSDKEMTYLRACNALFHDLEFKFVEDVLDCAKTKSSINRNAWLAKELGKRYVSPFVCKYIDGAMRLVSGIGPFYIYHSFYEFTIIDRTLRYNRDLNFGHYIVELSERAMYPQIVENIHFFDAMVKRAGPFSNPVDVLEGPMHPRYNLIARLVGVGAK